MVPAKVKGVRTTNGSASVSKPQTTVPGSKQTTLFGLAPGVPKPADKKGRKRKAAEGEGDDAEQVATSTSATSKRLDAFVKKPGSSQAAGLGAEAARELPREGEEMEETQVEDTQIEDTQPRSLEHVAEVAEEEELEETQIADTQEEPSVNCFLSLSAQVTKLISRVSTAACTSDNSVETCAVRFQKA